MVEKLVKDTVAILEPMIDEKIAHGIELKLKELLPKTRSSIREDTKAELIELFSEWTGIPTETAEKLQEIYTYVSEHKGIVTSEIDELTEGLAKLRERFNPEELNQTVTKPVREFLKEKMSSWIRGFILGILLGGAAVLAAQYLHFF